jgi:hypothetical protein
MPASASATKTAGYQVEFSKYPVLTFHIVMNSFNDIAASSGKWIFLYRSDVAVDLCQAFVTQTIKKSICQE